MVNDPPRFSVIMNVFNGEKYLEEAIESVLAQTFTDWDLLIWDDRSTDGCAEICRRYEDERIRYFLAPEHTPLGTARNLAMKEARAPWLAFIDQDDVWAPHKLREQNRLIEENRSGKLGLVYGRTMQLTVDGPGKDFDRWHEFSDLPEGDICRDLIRMPSFVSLCSVVFLRTAVEELGGIPDAIKYCPDYYLIVMVARNYHAACLQETCCWYRVHDSNMSVTYRIPIHWEALDIMERCSDVVDRKILHRKKIVHKSLIGLEEIASGQAVFRGAWRILSEGSLLYLCAKPCVNAFRALRRWRKNP